MVGQASIQTARATGPSTMERSSGLPPPFGIQAPWPRPGGRQIEPGKAEQDGGMPLIEHRPKAVGRVAVPNCMKRNAATIRRTLSRYGARVGHFVTMLGAVMIRVSLSGLCNEGDPPAG